MINKIKNVPHEYEKNGQKSSCAYFILDLLLMYLMNMKEKDILTIFNFRYIQLMCLFAINFIVNIPNQ